MTTTTNTTTDKTTNMTITQEQLDAFRAALENEEKSAATLDKYGRDARYFTQWLGSQQLTHQAALQYKNDLLTRFAASSVNSILAALNSFFRFIGREDCRVRQVRV